MLKEEHLTHRFAQSSHPPGGKKGSQYRETSIKPELITSKLYSSLTKHPLFLSTGCGIERPRPWTIQPTILKTRGTWSGHLRRFSSKQLQKSASDLTWLTWEFLNRSPSRWLSTLEEVNKLNQSKYEAKQLQSLKQCYILYHTDWTIPLFEHCDDLGVEELEFGGLVTWCGIAFWKPLFIQFITLFKHWNKQFIYILGWPGGW